MEQKSNLDNQQGGTPVVEGVALAAVKNREEELEEEVLRLRFQISTMETALVNMLTELEACTELQKNKATTMGAQKSKAVWLSRRFRRKLKRQRRLTKEMQNSIRYKIGDAIVATAKNPLKIFLWPVWIFRSLRPATSRAK